MRIKIALLLLLLLFIPPAQAATQTVPLFNLSSLTSFITAGFNKIMEAIGLSGDKNVSANGSYFANLFEGMKKLALYNATDANERAKRELTARSAPKYAPITKRECWNIMITQGMVATDEAQNMAMSQIDAINQQLNTDPESGSILNRVWLTQTFCGLGTMGKVEIDGAQYAAEFGCEKEGNKKVKFAHTSIDKAILGKHCIPYDGPGLAKEILEALKQAKARGNYSMIDGDMREAMAAWLYMRMKLGQSSPKVRGDAVKTLDGQAMAYEMVEDLNGRNSVQNPLIRAFTYVMCPKKEMRADRCANDDKIGEMLKEGMGANYLSKYGPPSAYCFSRYQRDLAANISYQKQIGELGYDGMATNDMNERQLKYVEMIRENIRNRETIMNNAAKAVEQRWASGNPIPTRPIKVENEDELIDAIKTLTRALQGYEGGEKGRAKGVQDVKDAPAPAKPRGKKPAGSAPEAALRPSPAAQPALQAEDALRGLGIKLSGAVLEPLPATFPEVK